MNIETTESGNQITLALSGRLDTATAPELQEVLLPALNAAREVTLDFTRLEYVSSAGLRLLLSGEKAAKANGGRQTLVHVSQEILEVFEITGFTNVLRIEKDA